MAAERAPCALARVAFARGRDGARRVPDPVDLSPRGRHRRGGRRLAGQYRLAHRRHQRQPERRRRLQRAGQAYGKAGNLKEAIADFDTAIKLNPNFYQAYANRALVERRLERDDLALADYNRAIQINPNYDVAYVGRGNIYRQNGQLDLALADFNRAIQLDSSDPRAYHNRGLIYQAQGQYQLAIDDFSKAISFAPTAVEPFNARGLSYLATGDFKAALEDFNEVVKRDRNSYEGWTNQGLALEKLGERKQGLRRLRQGRQHQRRLQAGDRRNAPHPERQRRIGVPGANGGRRTPVSCGLAQGRLPQGGSRHRGIFIDVGVGDFAVLHEETHRPLALERLAGLARNAGPHAGRHDLIA